MRCRTRCATTGARSCGSPTSARSSTTRPSCESTVPTAACSSCSTSTRRTASSRWRFESRTSCAARSRMPGCDGAVKTSGAKGVHVFVPIDDATSAPEDVAAATRALAARDRAARSRDCDDRVHQGRPRRQGVRRLDTCRRCHGGLGLQPASASGGAGVVPGCMGRSRCGRTRRLHRAHRVASSSTAPHPGPS